MARLDARDTRRDVNATRKLPRQLGSPHEDGQTCPHCGNLYSWKATYCPPCRRPLR